MAETNSTIKTTVQLDVQEANMQLIKLNATATDGTKELTERLNAKNKAVKVQNELSEEAISNQEEELKLLQGVGASEKEIERSKKKLNAVRLRAAKLTENGEKQQRKLAQAYSDSKDPVKNLDKATGGLIGKMQAFLANPIGAFLALLVGAFTLFKEAMNSTEDGAASFNAIMAAVGQIFTNIITLISDVLEPVFTTLVELFTKDLNPVFEAFGGYIDAGKLALKGYLDAISLLLTPLKSLLAGAKAAALAISGDFEGAKQVMSDFKDETIATAKSMVDNFVAAGEGVVDTTNDIGDAFENAADSAGNLLSEAASIELAQNKLNKAKRDQKLTDAELNVLSKEALRDVKNFNITFEERFKALDDYSKLEKERSENSKSILDEEIALLERRRELGGNTKEDNEEYNNLLIERINLTSQLAEKERSGFRELKTLNSEKAAADKKIKADKDAADKLDADTKEELRLRDLESQFELDELDIERRRKKGEDVLQLELDFLERKKAQELLNTELTEKEKQVIEESYSAAATALEESANETKASSKKDLTKSSIKSAGQAFGVSKKVAIAEMIFAAPKAIGESFKMASSTYAPPLSLAMGALGAASTVAPIISGLNKIKSTNVPGLPSGGGGGGGGSAPTPPPPPPSIITDISANNAARSGADPSLTQNSTATASASVQGGGNNVVFSEGSYSDFKNQVAFKEEKTTF